MKKKGEKMSKPFVFINFKTYPRGTATHAVKLAQVLNGLTSPYQIAVCPQFIDIKDIKKTTTLPIYAQHCDNSDPGAHTGHIPPRSLKLAGCTGTLLNHSEYPLSLQTIADTIIRCRKEKLKTIVFAGSLRMIKNVLPYAPDYIAYEPKALVGGTISVTTANSDIITKAAHIIRERGSGITFLVGAGIHSKRDIEMALQLGADGVGIAHAVVNASEKTITRILT
jgi:triosephosphate isomerase